MLRTLASLALLATTALASQAHAAVPLVDAPVCGEDACLAYDLESNGFQACDDAAADGAAPEPLSTYRESMHAHGVVVVNPLTDVYLRQGAGFALWCRGLESEQLEYRESGAVVYAEGFFPLLLGDWGVGVEWRESRMFILGEPRPSGCAVDVMVDTTMPPPVPNVNTDPNPVPCPGGAGPSEVLTRIP